MKTLNKVKVATLEDLTPLIGKKVILHDKEIGLFLTSTGEVHAVHNICPHKEGPLSEGTVSGHYVYCPLHDQKIDLQTGLVQNPDTGCINVYQVEIIDEEIFICL